MKPINHSTKPVEILGDAPTRIWWRGRQWAVTEYGLEALDGTYPIAKSKLTEGLEFWGWPEQVTSKDWVDAEDFMTAWLVALALHGVKTEPEAVRLALDHAQKERDRR